MNLQLICDFRSHFGSATDWKKAIHVRYYRCEVFLSWSLVVDQGSQNDFQHMFQLHDPIRVALLSSIEGLHFGNYFLFDSSFLIASKDKQAWEI